MSFGIENDIRIVNPKHINPLDFLKIKNKKLYISQKVDGVLRKNLDKDELYPNISDKLMYSSLDGEYIKELDIYIVFNIRSEEFNFNDYYENSQLLIEEHPVAQNIFKNYSFLLDLNEDLEAKFSYEFNELIHFANKNRDKENKWWPKIFWSIKFTEQNFSIIDKLETYHHKIYSECIKNILFNNPTMCLNDIYTIPMDDYIRTDSIKTDGIIIMLEGNKKDIYKYKPQRCMTADILNIEDGKIYRNIWRNGWIPYEVRDDKVKPNPSKLIYELEQYNIKPWTIKDIIDITKENVYYHKEEEYDRFTDEYFRQNKKFMNNFIDDLFTTDRTKKVLDFGCGFQNNTLWKQNIMIDGIDIDLGILNSRYYNEGNKKQRLFIGNLCDRKKDLCQNPVYTHYDNIDLDRMYDSYDRIVSLMSIHNCFRTEDGFDNFMDFVNERTKINSEFLVTFIDEDELFCDEDLINLPGSSYLRKNKFQK